MGYEITEPTDTTTSQENTTDVTSTNDKPGTETGSDTPAADNPDATGLGTEGTPKATDAGESTTTEGSEAADLDKTEGEDNPSFYWGDEQVEITIDDEVDVAMKEKGLDAMAIAKELYAKDGGFNLSDETKEKLYAAFGKFSVDAYLSGLKAQNEMFILNGQRDAEKAEQANAERYTQVAKEIGGDEGWSRLEAFALETLSDDELAAFNEVMTSGSQYLQAYAVRELESRRTKAQGDDKVTLIPGNAATESGKGPLNRQDYLAEISKLSQTYRGDKEGYAKASAALDARRRAGMAAGL